ncbi:MAG: hypothetical protein HY060_06835 [Proteobacteria bacterium]|nr:hypothetical protein [Pseudomonadota bacterium]
MGYYRPMRRHAQAVRIPTLALLLALAACQTTPPLPALSPLEQARQFGYTERDLTPERVEISYLGARQRVVSAGPTPRDADTQPARAAALDFATWRAAQLALARGFKGLRIVDRQTHVDSHPETLYPGAGWGAWPYWRTPGGIIYGPPGFYSVPYVHIQARVTLTVELLAEPRPDDLDAAATIARLSAAHPGASGPASPPPRPTSQLPR